MQGDWMINLIVSMITLVPGAVLLMFAGRLEYSPFAGLNPAYVTVSRRVAARINRLLGTILVLGSLASLGVGLMYGVTIQVSILVIHVITAFIAVTEYSRRLAEIESLVLPPEGEPRPVPSLGLYGKLLVLASSITSLALAIASVRVLYGLDAVGIGVVMVSINMLPLYLAFLSIRRPEAYALPHLKESVVKVLIVSIPVSVSLIMASISLAILGADYWWIPIPLGLIIGAAPLIKTW